MLQDSPEVLFLSPEPFPLLPKHMVLATPSILARFALATASHLESIVSDIPLALERAVSATPLHSLSLIHKCTHIAECSLQISVVLNMLVYKAIFKKALWHSTCGSRFTQPNDYWMPQLQAWYIWERIFHNAAGASRAERASVCV